MNSVVELAPRTTARTEQVLIIEDEPTIVQYLIDELQSQNVFAREAEDPEQGFAAVRDLLAQGVAPLVIILDLMFYDRHDPEEGLSLINRIRNLPEFDQDLVHIIVSTGFEDATTPARALSLGAREYFVKGKNTSQMLDAVQTYLGNWGLLTSSFLEIADLDPHARTMEVRYRSKENRVYRCILPSDLAPPTARIAGASFWLDIRRSYHRGKMSYQTSGKEVSRSEDAEAIRNLLGEDK